MEKHEQRLRKRLLAAVREDLQADDIEAAIRRFVRLSGLESENPSYHLKRGELEQRRGRNDAAADAFGTAARLFGKGAFDDKAASLYKRALSCDPGRVDLVLALASSYARLGRLRDATELLRSHAAGAAEVGNLDQSIDLQRALLRMTPDATSVRLNLADQLERSNRESEALLEYVEGAISLAEATDPDGILTVFDRMQDLMEKGTVPDESVLGRMFHGVARAYSMVGAKG